MENLEYNYIKRRLLQLTGIDLNCYKAPQMQRRLDVYLTRSAYPNWPKLFRAFRDNPALLSDFKSYLTINVSAFFRDPNKFEYLQSSILPSLLAKRPTLSVWSAGCSRGQEAYSIAMLLAEASDAQRPHRILGTDIDQAALDWAQAGGPYNSADMEHVKDNLLARHFSGQNNVYQANSDLRRKVKFRQHNLLTDPIVGRFDLIICRNVVIYFQSEAKKTLYRRFYDALRPGGVLFVGGTEIIPKSASLEFEPLNVSFYRRQAVKRLGLQVSAT